MKEIQSPSAKDRDVAQLVQPMLSMHEPWIQSLAPHKQGVMVHAVMPALRKQKQKESEVLGYPQLPKEFKASLGIREILLKN